MTSDKGYTINCVQIAKKIQSYSLDDLLSIIFVQSFNFSSKTEGLHFIVTYHCDRGEFPVTFLTRKISFKEKTMSRTEKLHRAFFLLYSNFILCNHLNAHCGVIKLEEQPGLECEVRKKAPTKGFSFASAARALISLFPAPCGFFQFSGSESSYS